ncbi:conserved hypothetical protein [Burkholderiales bacterium 8X]|nr:conserved hypothetical protein [Burkholderiales bacterium 8X]
MLGLMASLETACTIPAGLVRSTLAGHTVAMAATPDEFQRVVEAFERAHAPLVRALADLHVRGNMILEEHGFLEGPVGAQFEEFILVSLTMSGTTKEQFAEALRDLDRMHLLIGELDSLP